MSKPFSYLIKFRICYYLITTLLLVALTNHNSAAQITEKPARILFLVDASSSMLHPWQNEKTRFEAASRIITSIIDSIHAVNNEVAFAVRVFGSQFPAQNENCFDSKLEVAFAYQNRAQIQARLKHIRPFGYSPIAWSLKETAEKDFLNSEQYSYSIILITDGGESCGGDICATMDNLLSKKISFKPYVLSMIDYAPLKLEFDCFGNFMVIARENDITPAIQRIIEDNRKILSIKTKNFSQVNKTLAKPVRSGTPPPAPKPVTAKPVEVESEPVIAEEQPVKKPEAKVARAKQPVLYLTSRSRPLKRNLLYTLEHAKTVTLPRLPPVKIEIEDEKPQQTTVLTEPTIPRSQPPVKKPEPKAVIAQPAEEENIVLDVKAEDATKTQLQIYFTNGSGQYYNTEPKIILKNKATNKQQTLYRNMSGNEPTPIQMEEGIYDIIVPGSKATALNVPVLVNKNNKVYIKGGRGSIAFTHPTAPDKPIENYHALISKRFVRGSPVTKQLCTEELPYDPANYHIEINTLPPLVYNVDLNFNEIKLIAIPEPGSVQISNTERLGKVQFWHELGNSFVPFYELEVNGDLSKQKLDFLPGKYQVRYYKLPVQPYDKAELVQFSILSNQTTSVFLAP